MILLVALASAESLQAAFPTPAGATRAPADAFGEWLRGLPLRPTGTVVETWSGAQVAMPAARVVELPLVPGDLQQCADSILRLRATWMREAGRSPAFHYTSGWLSRWSDWAGGARPLVRGSVVSSRTGAASVDHSDAAFERWLTDLFTYAGTRSLPMDTVADTHPDPGDIVVNPGSPGHAVLVLDIASDGTRSWALIGQGYMPAMSFHVVNGPDGGWYPIIGDELPTLPITLSWSQLRRWD